MNVRFDSLEVKNGLTWRKLKIDLTAIGLALIVGPNGSGKTSIAELILDAFYGQTSKGLRSNSVINRKALSEKMGMTTEIHFARHEGESWVNYRLVKHQGVKGKPNGVAIYQGEKLISPVRDARAAQRFASTMLGLTFEEFVASVCLPQRAIHPLVSGTPSTRAKYITSVYGLEEYDELFEKVKSKLGEITSEVDNLEIDSERLKVLEKDIQQLPKGHDFGDTITELTERIQANEQKFDDIEHTLVRLLRRRDGQKRRERLLKDDDTEDSVQDRTAEDVRAFLRKEQRRREALRAQVPDLRRKHVLAREIAKLRERTRRVPDYARKERVKEREDQLSELRKQASVIDDRIELLESLSGRTHCPTCTQPLRGKADPAQLDRLRHEKKETRTKLSSLQDEQADYDEYEEIRHEIESKVSELEELPDGDYEAVRSRIEALGSTVEQAEGLLAKLVRREARREELAELPKGDYRKTQQRIDTETERKGDLRSKINMQRSALAATREKMQARERMLREIKRLRRANAGSVELREHIEILNDLAFAFGNKGMKLDRMREILRELEHRLPVYTGALVPRYQFRLAERESEIAFEYVDPKEGCTDEVRALSEGEKKRLSLAMLMAERDLRLVKTNLLFLDEFDGGIDRDGIDPLLDTLTDMRETYPSIFAISHDERVIGHSAFTSELRVLRKKYYSEMVVTRR